MYEELVKRCKALTDYNGLIPDEMIQEAFDCVKEAADAIEELSGKVEQLHELDAEEKAVFAAAIAKWGDQAQVMMVFEEMSELQKELCKNWRGKNNAEQIADEVADVEIMLAQLKMIYGIEDKVQEHRAYKIARLRQRLEG